MSKIKETIEAYFNQYRSNSITLQGLILKLCKYADYNIQSADNMGIFEEALDKES